MITVYFNDESHSVEPSDSLEKILVQQGYTENHFAIALNNKLLPRQAHASTYLKPDDQIDIIVPMQGG